LKALTNVTFSHYAQLACEFCDRWQHLVCYGYLGSEDPRIPNIHACYACLLDKEPPTLLRKFDHLTLLRKGMAVVMEVGWNKDVDFARQLGKVFFCHYIPTLMNM
jgi:meiosis-specific protein HOP1